MGGRLRAADYAIPRQDSGSQDEGAAHDGAEEQGAHDADGQVERHVVPEIEVPDSPPTTLLDQWDQAVLGLLSRPR